MVKVKCLQSVWITIAKYNQSLYKNNQLKINPKSSYNSLVITLRVIREFSIYIL